MEKYQIRNISEREVYDSYMGILRISPNPISESNDKLVDDPTNVLNTILSIDALTKIIKQTEIILSDSDGNRLPITFIPKSRMTNVMVCEGTSKVIEARPIINITTKISDEASLYVSEKFNSYSTLYLDNREEIKEDIDLSRVSPLQIISEKGFEENLLMYPIDSPHDENYFNDKNKLQLIDYKSSENRKSQLEKNLLKKSADWYNENIPLDSPERVKVADRYVTTYNNDGEIIPVLYTRDYVMGHYEGHTIGVTTDNASKIKKDWIGSKSSAYDRNDLKSITKLSWMRFDNLVWEVINNILTGNIRHTKGRYKKMGENETDHVMDALFNGGVCTLSNLTGSEDWMSKTAPLLGQGVQPGLIMYSAVPFRRYMFHVCRQMCTNMSHQFKNMNETSWVVNDESWGDFNKISERLALYKTANLITSAPHGAVSSIMSLAKDFILCDGKEVSYKNYPNLNLSNTKLFKNIKGFLAEPLENFEFSEKSSNELDGIHKALYSSSSNKFKTPNLYSIIDSSSRYIRSLNWDFNNEKAIDTPVDFSLSSTGASGYVGTLDPNNNHVININGDEIVYDEKGTILEDNRDVSGNYSNVIKNINEVGLYFYSYDNSIKRDDHYHAPFSVESGLHDEDEGEKEKLVDCVNYVTGRKSGGKNYEVDHKTALNHDFTYSVDGDRSYDWVNYSFLKGKKNVYDDYCPIPTCGLYLFNNKLYNRKLLTETASKTYAGTTSYVESKIIEGKFVYYDGSGEEHKILPVTPQVVFVTKFRKQIQKALEEDGVKITGTLKTTIASGTMSSIQSAVSGINRDYIFCKVFREVFHTHFEEKERRKLQMVKMNEAEGRIPASSSGGPLYCAQNVWSRRRRPGGGLHKQRRRAYCFRWKGVGNYNIGVNTLSKDDEHKTAYKYRCLTSIPYQNPKKLGAGDVTKGIEEDYYNKNSVTMLPGDIIHEEISFGGVSIDSKIVDRLSPSPEHCNLLPLIRI